MSSRVQNLALLGLLVLEQHAVRGTPWGLHEKSVPTEMQIEVDRWATYSELDAIATDVPNL